MKDLITFAQIDPRLGYKLMSGGQEATRLCFLDGQWQRKGADQWSPVLDIANLPASLQAWRGQTDSTVMLWACCGSPCRELPGVRAFEKDIYAAGGQISHGYCDGCAAAALREAEEAF